MRSDLAEFIATHGYIRARGVITGTTAQPGQSSAQLTVDCPEFTRATQQIGGQSVTLTLDVETARYLPLFTEVEVAIRVLGDDE